MHYLGRVFLWLAPKILLAFRDDAVGRGSRAIAKRPITRLCLIKERLSLFSVRVRVSGRFQSTMTGGEDGREQLRVRSWRKGGVLARHSALQRTKAGEASVCKAFLCDLYRLLTNSRHRESGSDAVDPVLLSLWNCPAPCERGFC
jgi:hypothetical protein